MIKYFKLITKENKKFLIFGSILTFFGSFFIGFETFLLSYVTSSFSTSFDYMGIVITLVLMFICAILAIICNFTGIRLLTHVSVDSIKEYRFKLFNKMQYIPSDLLSNYSSSSLINRLTIDVNNILQTLNFMIMNGIPSLWSLLFYIIFSIILVKYLSILYFLVFVIVLCVVIVRGRKSSNHYNNYVKNYDNLNASTKDNILGYCVIKSFQLEDHQKNKFKLFNKNMEKFGIKGDGYLLTLISILLSITNFFTIIILLLSGFVDYKINGAIKISSIIPFITYIFLSTFSFQELLQGFVYSYKTNISYNRVDEIMSIEVQKNKSNAGCDFRYGDIVFENVRFKYDSNIDEYVLNDINIKIKKNSFVSITGTIGSGKTSLIELITKIRKPAEGSILIDGIDISIIDTISLRKNIGYAFQNKMLFSGSIKDNILFGNESASIQELNEAANIACASSFIKNKDEGFDYLLTEGGKNLSGGQQQRVSIARAVARNPKILILDDSLSALDNITANQVIDNILVKFNESIIILVTQKIDLLKKSDQIIVLDNGEIEAIGKHNQLLKKSKTYKFINNSQRGI